MKEKKVSGSDKIIKYNERLSSLYENVIAWLKEAGVPCVPLFEDLLLSEDQVGAYTVKKLLIKQNSDTLAKFVPVGVLIIGAEGRVDLVGRSGKEILVYYSECGSETTTRMPVGNMVEERAERIYGQKREGWHWIDDRIIGKQPEFDKDIFLALLERIN